MKPHNFRKKWGQNFLQDRNTIHKIINVLDPQSTDVIIEIGPGRGALTFELAKKVKKIYAIEIDPMLIEYLKNNGPNNVEFIHDDILKFDLKKINSAVKVIGNLPYNITSPFIFKILNYKKWSKIVFMMQKEVADRITSTHGNKTYGRISVMVQAMAKVKLAFTVPNTVFVPKPNINSAIVIFKPNEINIGNYEEFYYLVKQAFSQRRKKLKNTLKGLFTDQELANFSGKRAEELTVSDFLKLHSMK